MEPEKRVRRLLVWNQVWLCLLILVLAAWWFSAFVARSREDMASLSAGWDGAGLKLRSPTDGPFVVTHVVNYGVGDKSWAALPRPLAVIDSYGAYLRAEDIRRLDWQDYFGQKVAAPTDLSHVTVLYYIPLIPKEREAGRHFPPR